MTVKLFTLCWLRKFLRRTLGNHREDWRNLDD